MKCSLGISNFLEEISSLSCSIFFLYFFALITDEGFLSSCDLNKLSIYDLSFLFFKVSFANFVHWHFHINFRIRLSVFTKKFMRYFSFRESSRFSNNEPSPSQAWYALHLFRHYKFCLSDLLKLSMQKSCTSFVKYIPKY